MTAMIKKNTFFSKYLYVNSTNGFPYSQCKVNYLANAQFQAAMKYFTKLDKLLLLLIKNKLDTNKYVRTYKLPCKCTIRKIREKPT